MLEADETAELGEDTDSGNGNAEGESAETEQNDCSSQTSEDDASPLGSPAQTTLKFGGALVLLVLALGHRRR